jgi:hypothetical protein
MDPNGYMTAPPPTGPALPGPPVAPPAAPAPAPALPPTGQEVDVESYAKLVGESSDDELAIGLRDNRDAILELIFTSMERKYRGGDAVTAVVHWEILDRPDGGSDLFEMVIEGGSARCSRTPQRDPAVRLRICAVDFLRLVTGHASGGKLFARRRLRASGNLKVAARIPSMFAIPGKGG